MIDVGKMWQRIEMAHVVLWVRATWGKRALLRTVSGTYDLAQYGRIVSTYTVIVVWLLATL